MNSLRTSSLWIVSVFILVLLGGCGAEISGDYVGLNEEAGNHDVQHAVGDVSCSEFGFSNGYICGVGWLIGNCILTRLLSLNIQPRIGCGSKQIGLDVTDRTGFAMEVAARRHTEPGEKGILNQIFRAPLLDGDGFGNGHADQRGSQAGLRALQIWIEAKSFPWLRNSLRSARRRRSSRPALSRISPSWLEV